MKDDGGSAFPRATFAHSRGCDTGYYIDSYEGMSLRDWFAGMALVDVSKRGVNKTSELAHFAYQIADAMIEERDK